MTCQRCEIDYLQDKTATLETIVARLINTLNFSEHSSERLKANHESADDLQNFRKRWPKKKCGHPAAIQTVTIDPRPSGIDLGGYSPHIPSRDIGPGEAMAREMGGYNLTPTHPTIPAGTLTAAELQSAILELPNAEGQRVVVVHQPGCGCGNCHTVTADSQIGQAIARQNERATAAIKRIIQPNPNVPVRTPLGEAIAANTRPDRPPADLEYAIARQQQRWADLTAPPPPMYPAEEVLNGTKVEVDESIIVNPYTVDLGTREIHPEDPATHVSASSETESLVDEPLPPLPPGEKHPYAPSNIPKRKPGRSRKNF